jgi:hypothetical protein
MALWTRPVVTHTALPHTAQKSAAITDGARAYKLSLLMLHLATMKAIYELILVPLMMLYVQYDVADHPALILYELVSQDECVEFIVEAVINRQRR